ncbi:phosphatase PAP2 family protein [Methylobacterium sp. EM32]|uniref:phosphatase PAP2 family protein n=1 Tax=Methylobacterium sp. EM32 TaxID=3163481 RepID=UPI0033B940E0
MDAVRHASPGDVPRARVRLWLLILAVAGLTAAWMRAAGLALEAASALLPAAACLGLELVATVYTVRRPDPRLAVSLSCVAQILGFSACAALLSYAVAATGGPLRDDAFLALDRALGLDWTAYLAALNDRPGLGAALTLAYRTLMPQMILVVVVLGFGGRLAAAREFVLAFVIAGVVTVVLSGLLPAVGTYAHLGLRPEDFSRLSPAAPYAHLADLTGLRDGTLRSITLDRMEGIITFPSFHTALGVLFIRYFWMSRITRWPGIALNGMMIAATPIDGGHYFVDVGAGAVIAVLAIGAAGFLVRAAGPAEGRRARPAWASPGGAGVAARGS